jgi:protein-disulfide isomerase
MEVVEGWLCHGTFRKRLTMALGGLAALALLLSAVVHAQTVPIPNRPDGYLLPSRSNTSALVQLDLYGDFMCPDTAAAWPIVSQVAQSYSASQLALRLHVFPLPYHMSSFTSAQGGKVVAAAGKDVFLWMEAVFAHQTAFGNNATMNSTWLQVANQFGVLASTTAGVEIPAAQFVSGLMNEDLNEDARVSWKIGCSRGVSGTPTFFVNGVRSAADETWTVAQWQALINPLLMG